MGKEKEMLLAAINKAIEQLKLLEVIERQHVNVPGQKPGQNSACGNALRSQLLAVLQHTAKTLMEETNLAPLRDFVAQAFQVASINQCHNNQEQELTTELASLQQKAIATRDLVEERDVTLNRRIAELKDRLAFETTKTEEKLQHALKHEDKLGQECCNRLDERRRKIEDEIQAVETCIEQEKDRGRVNQRNLCQDVEELETQLRVLKANHAIHTTDLQAEIDSLNSIQRALDVEIGNLRQAYELRLEVVEADRAAKEAAHQLQLQREQLIRTAIRIQAWWRGIMVRKGLGPYRKKKRGSHPKQRRHSNTRANRGKVGDKPSKTQQQRTSTRKLVSKSS